MDVAANALPQRTPLVTPLARTPKRIKNQSKYLFIDFYGNLSFCFSAAGHTNTLFTFLIGILGVLACKMNSQEMLMV